MDYVQTLLLAQAGMAAQMGGKTELVLLERMLSRKRTEEQTQREVDVGEGGAENSAGTQQDGRQAALQERENAPEALLARLRDLTQTSERAESGLLRGQEAQLRSAQQAQSVRVSQTAHSGFGGGAAGDFMQQMVLSGIAGRQTQRSMGEISRYFERDARRYGG